MEDKCKKKTYHFGTWRSGGLSIVDFLVGAKHFKLTPLRPHPTTNWLLAQFKNNQIVEIEKSDKRVLWTTKFSVKKIFFF